MLFNSLSTFFVGVKTIYRILAGFLLAILYGCGTMSLPQESSTGASRVDRSRVAVNENSGRSPTTTLSQPLSANADRETLAKETTAKETTARETTARETETKEAQTKVTHSNEAPTKEALTEPSPPSAKDTATQTALPASNSDDAGSRPSSVAKSNSSASAEKTTSASVAQTDAANSEAASALDTPLTKIQDNKIVIKSPPKLEGDNDSAKENTAHSSGASKAENASSSHNANNGNQAKIEENAQPENKPAKSKQVDVKPTVVSEDEVKYKLANRYYQTNRFQNTIDVLESSDNKEPGFPKSRELLINAYVKLARQMIERKEYSEAKTLLNKAKRLNPENAEVKASLVLVDNILESNKEFKLALEANNAGKSEAAFLLFRRVLELNPKNKEAAVYYSKLKETVVTKRHKNALKLFRSQQLNAAIKEWEQLLKLDPDNELAKIYISRAIEMRNRIQNL